MYYVWNLFQCRLPDASRRDKADAVQPIVNPWAQAKTTWAPAAHPAYASPDLPTTKTRNGWTTYAPPGDVHKSKSYSSCRRSRTRLSVSSSAR